MEQVTQLAAGEAAEEVVAANAVADVHSIATIAIVTVDDYPLDNTPFGDSMIHTFCTVAPKHVMLQPLEPAPQVVPPE